VRADGVLRREQVVLAGEAGRLERAPDGVRMPELLEAEDVRLELADHALRPVDLFVVFSLGPAVLVRIDRHARLVEIVEVEGANAHAGEIHVRLQQPNGPAYDSIAVP
jgi:hypothetical protein